eukprot:TRINITY_DN462_c0_g1_i3.p2 TRINITY_DN462_c0_g1~~TRINITY_DN462_c0_g1_i3.p2  ORF type:complete len:295 (-),score=5.19 TRINITY_DN462_c0_g1_i3:718-1602(-)
MIPFLINRTRQAEVFQSAVMKEIIPSTKSWRIQLQKMYLKTTLAIQTSKNPVVVLMVGKNDRQSSDSFKLLESGLKQLSQKCVRRIMAKDVYAADPLGLQAYNVNTYDELLIERVYVLVSSCPEGCILLVENFQYLHIMVLPVFLEILQGVQNQLNKRLTMPMMIILSTSKGAADDVLFDQQNGDDVQFFETQTLRWLRTKNYTMWQKDLQALQGYLDDIDARYLPSQKDRYRNINYIVDYKQFLISFTRSVHFILPIAANKASARQREMTHKQLQKDFIYKELRNQTQVRKLE